jgi:hypothetical protein
VTDWVVVDRRRAPRPPRRFHLPSRAAKLPVFSQPRRCQPMRRPRSRGLLCRSRPPLNRARERSSFSALLSIPSESLRARWPPADRDWRGGVDCPQAQLMKLPSQSFVQLRFTDGGPLCSQPHAPCSTCGFVFSVSLAAVGALVERDGQVTRAARRPPKIGFGVRRRGTSSNTTKGRSWRPFAKCAKKPA